MQNKEILAGAGAILVAALVAFILNHHIISVVLVIFAVFGVVGSLEERKTEHLSEHHREEKKKQKPKKLNNYRFSSELRGHFLHERQRKLSKLYRMNNPEDNEAIVTTGIYFQYEPDNKHDPNAIAVYHEDYGQLGYIARELTGEFREKIDINLPYKTNLSIYKDPSEYWADFSVNQKR